MANDESTPEQDIATAQQALAKGELVHALHHVGCALSTNVMHPEWMQLLNQIVGQITQRPDPLSMVELGDDTNFIDAANRSYVLAWLRRWEEALDLITDVAEVRPDIPYLMWAEWWLSQPGVPQQLTWEQFASGILIDLAKIASSCPAPTAADDPRLPNLQSAARLLAGVRGLHGNQSFVWFLSSMIGRRLGTLDEALQMAQHAYKIEPAWKNAIGVANVLRDQKKVDEATKWFRKAIDHDKEDVSAHLDMGDMFLDDGRYDDAIKEYERALAKEDGNKWAEASRYYAWYKKTGNIDNKLALLRCTESDGGNRRASMLAREMDPPEAYVTYLPAPGDASCNGLNAIFQQMFQNPAEHHGSTVKLKLSHLESPSVVGGFWLQMEMWGPQLAFDYQVEKIQTPDPRQPKAQVPFVIWQWEGTQPKPAVQRPDRNIHNKLHALASEPFHFDIWVPRAQALARELGVGAIQQLLGALVYPPKPPGSNWKVLNWTQRAQVATCLVLAHIDEGWQGSKRQQVLYSLLYGPTDWTTGAAMVALGVLARKDPAIRRDVEQAFTWMQNQIPAEGFCCWEYPLVCTWLAIGGHDEATKKRLETWRDKVLDEEGKSTVHICELEAKKFDFEAEKSKAAVAQQQVAAGGGGEPDPTVFPGQRVAKLSDYVGLMKQMQTGNMMGALGAYGLDMMGYASVATAWGQKLGADPTLNAKFAAMMAR